jgi:hypothetical protein
MSTVTTGRRPTRLPLALSMLTTALTAGRALPAQNRCGVRKIAVGSAAATRLLCLDAKAAGKGPAAQPARMAHTCLTEAALPVYFECTKCADNGKPIAQLYNTQTTESVSLC